MLSDGRLVNESAARAEDAGNLPQRSSCARQAAADVIAGPEVDHQIEERIGEGEIANVALDHGRRESSGPYALPRDCDECWIDVHAHQCNGTQAFGEHRKGNATPASDLQHATADGRAQRAKKQRDLDALLQAVPCLDVAKGSIFARPGDARRQDLNWRVFTEQG